MLILRQPPQLPSSDHKCFSNMRALQLIKEKGVYPTYIGYKHEVLKSYYQKKARFLHKGNKASYSQYCEDLILDRLTGYKAKGFYVDVGANDPVRFSNTKKFYDRGWAGINIDPNPYCYKLLKAMRPRDINLNIGIGEASATLPFYDFLETEISTFSADRAIKVQNEGYTLRQVIDVPMKPLAEVLKDVKHIDFLSIDAEDQNFEVLKSHDWKVKPTVICIENDTDHDYEGYLKQYGYKKVATTLLNSFFARD